MKSKNFARALFYLGLNAIVSACVAWGVLTLWWRSHVPPAPPTPVVAVIPLTPTPTPPVFVYTVHSGDTLSAIAQRFRVPETEIEQLNGLKEGQKLAVGQALLIPGTPTPQKIPGGALEISGVLGAGILEDEHVLIVYHGAEDIDLEGWQIDDGEGHRFVFPALRLSRNGAVQVWTKGGLPNTVVDLYWGLKKAIWQSGKTVRLRSPDGKVVATYKVP